MRKVTREVMTAFLNGEHKTVGNTMTNGTTVWLHGNAIAWRENGGIVATLAGWPTVTTRERLNGLCNLLGYPQRFWQDKGVQYFENCYRKECVIGPHAICQID